MRYRKTAIIAKFHEYLVDMEAHGTELRESIRSNGVGSTEISCADAKKPVPYDGSEEDFKLDGFVVNRWDKIGYLASSYLIGLLEHTFELRTHGHELSQDWHGYNDFLSIAVDYVRQIQPVVPEMRTPISEINPYRFRTLRHEIQQHSNRFSSFPVFGDTLDRGYNDMVEDFDTVESEPHEIDEGDDADDSWGDVLIIESPSVEQMVRVLGLEINVDQLRCLEWVARQFHPFPKVPEESEN